MIAYERLAACPLAFASLGGLNSTDFEALYQDFAAAHAKDRQQSLTRAGKPRWRTRLPMALAYIPGFPAGLPDL